MPYGQSTSREAELKYLAKQLRGSTRVLKGAVESLLEMSDVSPITSAAIVETNDGRSKTIPLFILLEEVEKLLTEANKQLES